jgi:hypothetical protein
VSYLHPQRASLTSVSRVSGFVAAFLLGATAASGQTAAAARPAPPSTEMARQVTSPAAADATFAQNQERLTRLLKETRLDFTTSEKSFVVKFDGQRADSISVYVSVYEDLALIQSQTLWSASAASRQLEVLLRLNFDSDLVKLGISEDRLIALTETELRTLDATLLKRLIQNVADFADETYGTLAAADRESATYAALAAPPASGRAMTLDLLRGRASLRFDGSVWTQFYNPGEPSDIMQYKHDSEELFFKVTADRIEVPLDKIEDFNLTQMKAVDPKVRVARRGSRMVNGQRLVVLEIDATIDAVPFTFLGHYYSSDAGTVQIVAWTGRNLLNEKRPLVEAIVSGFQVRK